MQYILLIMLFYPILIILSIFRKNKNKTLVIQTAKIGDYVNSSVIFQKLSTFDIIIDKVNYEFSINDNRIKNIYIINNYKKGINRYKLAFKLFWNNYENVYILMPNSLNLFLAQISFAKNKITLQHYNNKWYEKILMLNMKKIIHTKENLTIENYLKMIDEDNLQSNWKSLPVIKPNKNIINSNKFKIGISLSAGNKLKTIDDETWKKIFSILELFECEYYIFGLQNEKIYLDKIKQFNLKNPIISLLGKIELKLLPFYISQMNLYISSDTGNSYIADAFNIPLINFAGPCYMNEQRPIGDNVLIVYSNAKCTPYSAVFKTEHKIKCSNLYKINKHQENKIKNFIVKIYKDFQSEKYNYSD